MGKNPTSISQEPSAMSDVETSSVVRLILFIASSRVIKVIEHDSKVVQCCPVWRDAI